MPFLIPLVGVAAGVIVGEVAVALAIGSAVVGAVGYITKNEDLMKIGGLLGLGSGIAGLVEGATGAAAGEIVADELGTTAAQEAANAEMLAATDYGAATGAGAGVPLGEGSGQIAGTTNIDSTELLGPPNVAESAIDTGLSDTSGTIPSDSLAPPPIESSAPPPIPSASAIPSTSDGIINDIIQGYKGLSGEGQAAVIKVGGEALAGAFGENPQADQVKLNKEKQAFEIEQYKRRLRNLNNIGMITLGMNPTPINPATGLPYPKTA